MLGISLVLGFLTARLRYFFFWPPSLRILVGACALTVVSTWSLDGPYTCSGGEAAWSDSRD